MPNIFLSNVTKPNRELLKDPTEDPTRNNMRHPSYMSRNKEMVIVESNNNSKNRNSHIHTHREQI